VTNGLPQHAHDHPRARRVSWSPRSALAAVLAAGCVAFALPTAVPGAVASPEDDLVSGALGLLPGDAVSAVPAPPVTLDDSLRPTARGIRVAILSSGVDTSVLPESLRGQVGLLGSGGDPVGYGTYTASVLLQLDPGARITSIGVYPNGRFNADWQAGAMEWAKANAKNLDAVLYAVPPSEFLDPVSATMAAGQWDATADAISDQSLAGSRGPVFGVPLSGGLRGALTRDLPPTERALIDRFSSLTSRWAQARAQVKAINAAGVAVVAPAGDQGPGPQSVLGIANFPEVVAVGAFDGTGVTATSASGPSMEGRVKPDLVGPTGLVGLLPPSSALARALAAKGVLDPGLQPAWSAGAPLTDARARLDSTMVPATVVAAATAGMAAQGLRDVDRQRGALTAAAVPLAGVPVWRQGAGVLRRVPDAAFATSRPLALSSADLGAQPESGLWTATVAFSGGAPTGATSSFTDRQEVSPDGRPALSAVDGADAPPVTARAGNGGVEVSLPLGDGSYRGGLYCGYTDVSVPLTDATASPTVDVHGIPSGTEQVPTCAVQGNRLRGFGFYIHDIPAEDLTFGLLPAIPVGGDLLHHALMLLPVDPLATKLFFKVTDAGGNARFPNVPPGYYKIRQWSDYGAPVREVVNGQVRDHEIGEPVAYQSFEALVLSGLCTDDTPEGNNAAVPGPCQEKLVQAFGAENVAFEKPTLGYLVTTGPQTTRVIFDRFKKMPGAGVASRYIDQIDPVKDLKFLSVDVPATLSAAALGASPATAPAANPWSLTPAGADPTRALAAVSPALAGQGTKVGAGVAAYPFALTTPNYKAHMSLNFSYDLDNAAIVAVVVVGKSVHYGVVTPNGSVQQPSVGLTAPLAVPPTSALLRSTGTANFEFHMLPKGASQGTLYLVFVPAYSNTAVSTATLGDLSFELDTWNNTLWPATTFGVVHGHAFSIDSNYSTTQLRPGTPCRGTVCEDWEVMVHSPGDDAATFDVVDAASGVSVLGSIAPAGGGLFDPRRGVHDFTHTLAFAAPTLAGVEVSATIPNAFRTNGRFWEQLALPGQLLAAHPGVLEMRIEDNRSGRLSTLLPHAGGPVPVAPYIPFTSSSTLISIPTTTSGGISL